jgi:hypothetical protein
VWSRMPERRDMPRGLLRWMTMRCAGVGMAMGVSRSGDLSRRLDCAIGMRGRSGAVRGRMSRGGIRVVWPHRSPGCAVGLHDMGCGIRAAGYGLRDSEIACEI